MSIEKIHSDELKQNAQKGLFIQEKIAVQIQAAPIKNTEIDC